MSKTIALSLTALLGAGSVAFAGNDSDEQRSDTGATALSIAGSALGVTALLSGADASRPEQIIGLTLATTGPAFGHYYAGHIFTIGTGLRGAGLAAMVYGLDAYNPWEEHSTDKLITLGAVAYIGGTVYDIVTAGRAAREYNREHSLQLSPAPIRDTHGQTSAGLALAGQF